MSFRDATQTTISWAGPLETGSRARLSSGPSVEAETGERPLHRAAAPAVARERILAWLAEGAREVTWALCSLPRERWAEPPPSRWATGPPCATRAISPCAKRI